MNKKGLFEMFTDAFTFLLFIFFALFFLFIASFSNSQINKDSIESDFSSIESDNILTTLLRTKIDVYTEFEGLNVENIADLIAVIDENNDEHKQLLNDELYNALFGVCHEIGTGPICKWTLRIPDFGGFFTSFKVEYDPDEGDYEKIGEASAYLPRNNGEVTHIEFIYYEKTE